MIQGQVHRLSKLAFRSRRDFPHGEESRNAQLLIRAGFVSKVASGIYTLLPFGLRVLNRIEGIVRREMENLNSSEVLLSALHPKALWDKTGRWDSVDVLYKVQGRSESQFCLGPTHEEVVTPVAKELLDSYKSLPLSVFQLQTKFRDEPRARSGLLRGREFRMKDMYSFHLSEEDLESYYQRVVESYHAIFNKLGIGDRTYLTYASGGTFSQFSHEFQMVSEAGEDTIFLDRKKSIAINKEIIGDERAVKEVFGNTKPELEEVRAVEVGNIFKLGTRFSSSFDLALMDINGSQTPIKMGCYGIGTTRLLGAIAEVCSDNDGLVWPSSVSPYDIHLVIVGNSDKAVEWGLEIASRLSIHGNNILIDERLDVRAGEKFKDADLVGIPLRVTAGERGLKDGMIEVFHRKTRERFDVAISELETALKSDL